MEVTHATPADAHTEGVEIDRKRPLRRCQSVITLLVWSGLIQPDHSDASSMT